MSRRIAYLALAAATLIVTPAAVSNACSKGPCHSTQLPPPVQQVSAQHSSSVAAPAQHAAAPQQIAARASRPVASGGHGGMRAHARSRGHLRRGSTFWPLQGGVGFIDGPLTQNTNVALGYPPLLHDPSWQLCQIDPPFDHPYLCGPYSYRPYGVFGYRPLGNYRPYKPASTFAVAPNARIIRIEPNDQSKDQPKDQPKN